MTGIIHSGGDADLIVHKVGLPVVNMNEMMQNIKNDE